MGSDSKAPITAIANKPCHFEGAGKDGAMGRGEIFYTLHPDMHIADLVVVKDLSSYPVRNDMMVKDPTRVKIGASGTKISVCKPLNETRSKALFSNNSGLPGFWLSVICNLIGTITAGHLSNSFFHGFGGQPLTAQAVNQYRESKRCWAFNGF